MEVVSPISCSPPSSPKSSGSPSSSPYKRARGHSTSSHRPSLLARRSSKPDFLNSLLNLSSPGTSSTPPLSRASSALNLLYASQSQPHPLGEAPPSPGPHASPVVSTSTATATGTLRAPRRTPSAALPFVPLTPIMASPRLTPVVSAITGERPRSSLAYEGVSASEDGSAESQTTSGESASQVNDYLTCGGGAVPALAVPVPVPHTVSSSTLTTGTGAHLAPPPTWTSTPPTPPPKQSLEMFPSRSASRSSQTGRSKSRSHSRARAATHAGLSGTRGSRSPSRARPVPSSSSLASAATVTASTSTLRGRHPVPTALMVDGEREKRRMSLPPNLSRLDPGGSARGTTASSPARGGRVTASPLRAVRSGMGVKRQGSKKLFHLGDTEGSDGEGEETEEGRSAPVRIIRRLSRRSSRSSRSSREVLVGDGPEREPRMALDIERESISSAPSLPKAPPPSPQTSLMTTESEGWKEREREKEEAKVMSEAEVERLRAATRKYHALMELLATEAGYLMDLRALVTVYLEQLPTLSTAAPSSSTSPTLSIPSLGLSRSIPSSRSSFLHPHPSPSTSASSHLSVPDDTGHGAAEKEKKRDKSRERLKDKDKHKDKHKARSSEKENTKGRDAGKHRHKGKEKVDAAAHDAEEEEKEDSVAGHEALGPAPPRSQTHHRKHAQTRRPILAERGVSAICRNAQELLAFHGRFVSELREALVGFGLSRAFEMGERKEEVAMKLDGSEAAVLPTIDQAVAIVAEKFVTESQSFSIYEGFCPGHNEAVNLIRNVQENYPNEWDAYEQRCSLLVAHQFDLVNPSPESHSDGHGADGVFGMPTSATISPLNPPVVEGTRTKRRHSTSSLTLPFSTSHADLPKVTANRSEPIGGEHSRSRSGHEHTNVLLRQHSQQATRLRLLDYLIKPVQRVCKYPLLVDQLRTKRARTQSAVDPSTRPSRAPSVRDFRALIHEGGDVVERAGEAMRLVVSLVNRASETQARLVRSSLITSRMVFTQPTVGSSKDGHASSPAGASSPVSPTRTQDLSPDFVASLGAVRLAGALDVVHHPSALHMVSAGSMRAKYFGAFLYSGGYLILVKIPRNGKVYEPRYWFSLVGFDLFDFEGDESSLPFSFHICGHGHHLQLAAACQPEKVIWINAIQEALSHGAPWTSEPPSSLLLEDKVQSAPAVDEGPSEWSAAPLPTIQSDPELEGQARDQPPDQAAHGRGRPELKSRPPSRIDTLSFRHEQQAQMASFAALSRRSSTASVKAFFSPMTLDPSTRIPRPSAQVRQQVDHGLHDVYSDQCLAARSHATMKHEDLFKRPLPAMTRSNSGLSISGAMGLAAKRRYDMVSGKRASLDGGREHDPDIGSKRLSTLPGRAKPPASPQKRLKKPLPSLVPTVPSNLAKVESEAESDSQTTQSPAGLMDSPFPPSQCSSTTSSNLPSPIDIIDPILGDIAQDATLRPSDVLTAPVEDWRPKRTRSMVDNVKYFFQSRPASPSSASSHQSATPPPLPPKQLEVDPQTPPPPSSLTQWWRKGSLRRRVQSSPDVPGDEAQDPPPLLSRASADGRGTFLVQTSEEPMLQPSVSSPASPAAGTPGSSRRVSINDSTPTRRRSLFAPTSRQHEIPSPQPSPGGSSVIPRRSLRNVWFFQRSNSFTPMDVKEPVS